MTFDVSSSEFLTGLKASSALASTFEQSGEDHSAVEAKTSFAMKCHNCSQMCGAQLRSVCAHTDKSAKHSFLEAAQVHIPAARSCLAARTEIRRPT